MLGFIRAYFKRREKSVEATTTQPSPPGVPHRRFLTDNPMAYMTAVDAAKSYVTKLEAGEVGWLHAKPFDPTPGNPQFFRLMFDLLNILQKMQIATPGRILEVGSGSGWITEILVMLGFSVDAVEPSSDLTAIAQERCAALASHYRHSSPPSVRFHEATLEEVEFDDESFDAILFFDVLHHVVHETVVIEKSFRFLKPGGCVGVVEGAWHPDFSQLEQDLMAEMSRTGTLESPFSAEYLDHLLAQAGFIEIQRFAAVNGFFTSQQLSQPLRNFTACTMQGSNNVTARKPSQADNLYPRCTDFNRITEVRLRLLSGGIRPADRTASLTIEIENAGQTLLDGRVERVGHITFALRRGTPGTAGFMEANERHLLAETLIPGQSLTMQLVFTLPPEASLDKWVIDPVAEGVYWLSTRGGAPCPVACL